MYYETAFNSRKHQFSTYEKTDFIPSLFGLPRNNKIDKNFLNEPVPDFTFAGSFDDIDCLRDHNLDLCNLNLHRYHYGFGISIYEGGPNYFVFLIALFLLLLGLMLFFIRPESLPLLSQGEVVFIICSVLLFKLNLYYQSGLRSEILKYTQNLTIPALIALLDCC